VACGRFTDFDNTQPEQRVAKALKLHRNDPNFPHKIILKFEQFLGTCVWGDRDHLVKAKLTTMRVL